MRHYVCGMNKGIGGPFGEKHRVSVVFTETTATCARLSFKTVKCTYTLLMVASPKRGGAVIEPRTYTDNPKKFAQTTTRLTAGPIHTPQHGAAELQHALSNTIREYLLDRGISLQQFCADYALPTGLSYERLYRISNGSTMMGLTDILFWSAVIPGFTGALTTTMNNLASDLAIDITSSKVMEATPGA
jgi:hypothetical protein